MRLKIRAKILMRLNKLGYTQALTIPCHIAGECAAHHAQHTPLAVSGQG